MCARSQHSGDMSSDTCPRWAASGTGARRPSVQRRASSSDATISGFVTTSDGAGGPVVEEVVGGAPGAEHVALRVVLRGRDRGRVGPDPFERVLGGVEAPPRGLADGAVAQRVAGRGIPSVAHG